MMLSIGHPSQSSEDTLLCLVIFERLLLKPRCFPCHRHKTPFVKINLIRSQKKNPKRFTNPIPSKVKTVVGDSAW
ncbi:hypothetical protein Hdeb2414_s0007g00253081 [Helianthus debilis subsp. tardiflorus]